MNKKMFIFRGKETSYDYGWTDDITFTFDFGDGDKDFVDDDGDEYFIHCQYCADPNCDHCDSFWFGIWWEHDSTEADEPYLTAEEKEEIKQFMISLMDVNFVEKSI
jgi:hypothetical protein